MITYNTGERVYHRTMGYGTIVDIIEVTTPETNFTPEVIDWFIVTRLDNSQLTIRSKIRPGQRARDLFVNAEDSVRMSLL